METGRKTATETPDKPAGPAEAQGRVRGARQKRFANRSKTGCLTCRKRRVRCDEGKPTCASCIRVGRECAYEDPFVRVAIRPRSRDSGEGAAGSSSSSSGDASESRSPTPGTVPGEGPVLDFNEQGRAKASAMIVRRSPYDAFFGTPFEVPASSRVVLQDLIFMRQLNRPPGFSEQPFILEKMVTNPGYLHSVLLMGCIQRFWFGTSLSELKVPLATHRLAAVKYANEQLANRETANTEHTISTLSILGLVEGTMYDVIGFDMGVADTCTRAINRVRGRKVEDIGKHPEEMTPLASICMMLTPELDINIYDIRGQSIHALKRHGPLVAAIYYPIPLGSQWLEWPDDILRGQSQGWEHRAQAGYIELAPVPALPFPVPRRPKPQPAQDKPRQSQHPTHMPPPAQPSFQPGRPPPPTLNPYFHYSNRSFSAFFLTSFYLAIRHPRSAITAFNLQWLVESFHFLLLKMEPVVAAGNKRYPPSKFLFVAIYGAAAAASMATTSDREKRERSAWEAAFAAKMRWISGLGGFSNWEAAEEALVAEGWKRVWNGREAVKKLWEDAVLGFGHEAVEELVS